MHRQKGFFLDLSLQPRKGHGVEFFNWGLIEMALTLLVDARGGNRSTA